MLHIERFINELMSSNCYLVADDDSKHCICIDPASEKSEREIAYIGQNGLTLDYIILTHEHTDHTWGVNSLLEHYPLTKVVCSELCKEALPKEAKAYFRFYYDDPNYEYRVKRVDFTTEDVDWNFEWEGHRIIFMPTPGHSPGSVVIDIDGILFGGDTLMPFKPFIKKRNGGSREYLIESIAKIEKLYSGNIIVYPGHGDAMSLNKILVFFKN